MLRVRGDRGGSATWYVLVFFDEARRISRQLTQSTSRYDVYAVNGEQYGVRKVLLLEGRRPAAEAVLQYLFSANAALENMPAIHSPNVYAFGKIWDFRAFTTEAEAKAVHTLLTPSSTSSR